MACFFSHHCASTFVVGYSNLVAFFPSHLMYDSNTDNDNRMHNDMIA